MLQSECRGRMNLSNIIVLLSCSALTDGYSSGKHRMGSTKEKYLSQALCKNSLFNAAEDSSDWL